MNHNIQKTIEQLYAETPDSVVSVSYGHKQVKGRYTDTKAIVYGVVQKKPLSELDPSSVIPDHIIINGQSIPTDVVERKSQFKPLSNCFAESDPSSDAHRALTRPLLGGISIGTEDPLGGTGTLGGIVKDNEDGTCCILSNNHVLVNDAIINSYKDPAKEAYSIRYLRSIQPGTVDNGNPDTDYIGYVKRYYPLDPNSTNNYIDAALSCINKRAGDNTSFKFLGLDNDRALNFATTSEINSLIDNDIPLFKSGRTTGFTGGSSCPIKALEINVSILVGSYGMQDSGVDIDFADQILFAYQDLNSEGFPRENVVVPGDSGSFLIGEFNGVKKIVGLIFASGSLDGTTPWNGGVACRIDRVKDLLNITRWNGTNFKGDNRTSWIYVQTSGLSDIVNFTVDNKRYWQVGTASGNDGLDSLYLSSSNDLLTMCLLADSCTGKAPEVDCPTPPPTTTPTPAPTPPPPPPSVPRANFNYDADWNSQNGNVTSVGTNGGPSYYNTYDQNGNVWELTDNNGSGESSDSKISLGGAWDSSPEFLDKCVQNLRPPALKDDQCGIRIVRLVNNNINPYTLYAHSCGYWGSPPMSAVYVFDRTGPLSFEETKRYNKDCILFKDGCVKQTVSNSIANTGNGRALWVHDNIIFHTFTFDPKIYKTSLVNGSNLGFIETPLSSMSTMAYDGTHYYCADYAGQPLVYVINITTGAVVRTIQMKIPKTNPPLPYEGMYMDGLEYFDGKLIMNRGDTHPIYDIYDLNGNVLVENFIDVRNHNIPIFEPGQFMFSMGVAYDGTNFIVSLYRINAGGLAGGTPADKKLYFAIFSGNDGEYIGLAEAKINDCNTQLYNDTYHVIEDLSINYDARPDIGDRFFTEWSYVSDSNNPADDYCEDSRGAVDYNFRIQRYQLTNVEYVEFLNAVARSSDNYELYDSRMGTDPRGGITRSGLPGAYSYSVKTNMTHKPVIYVNWFNAARLCNWLHNRADDNRTTETETGAYTLNGEMTTPVAPNTNARYRLPTINEWHKAAYYRGGNAGLYWEYAMQTNTRPCSVTATSIGDGSLCATVPPPSPNDPCYTNGAPFDPDMPSITISGIVITESHSGSISYRDIELDPLSYSCSGTIKAPSPSVWLGESAAFTYTLHFNQLINSINIELSGYGTQETPCSENFIFTCPSGDVSISNIQSCYATISNNSITGTGGTGTITPLTNTGGGIFTITNSLGSFNELTISGDGGCNGSLLSICSVTPAT